VIGFLAGIVVRLLAPGPNNPSGFVLTALLGSGGSLIVRFVWHRLVSTNTIGDVGMRGWR